MVVLIDKVVVSVVVVVVVVDAVCLDRSDVVDLKCCWIGCFVVDDRSYL